MNWLKRWRYADCVLRKLGVTPPSFYYLAQLCLSLFLFCLLGHPITKIISVLMYVHSFLIIHSSVSLLVGLFLCPCGSLSDNIVSCFVLFLTTLYHLVSSKYYSFVIFLLCYFFVQWSSICRKVFINIIGILIWEYFPITLCFISLVSFPIHKSLVSSIF